MYRIVTALGFIALVIFESMASVVLLQVLLKALSQKMEASRYSFDYYGMFWGMSAIFCPVLMLVLHSGIKHLSLTTFNPDIRQSEYVRYIWPVIFSFPIIFCVPVAIYFAIKFKLTTPSVYLLPAKLLCCCNEKRARILVVSLTLWFDLVAAYFLVGHGVFALLALLVEPFIVAVNVMLLVLTFMCLTYIMALVFTVCASVDAQTCLRKNGNCCTTLHAAMLIPLLLAVICFSFMGAISSQFVNTTTQQSSFLVLKPLFTPFLLAVVSLSLKKIISVWMHWSLGGVEGDNAVDPQPGHRYNRYQPLDNTAVDSVH